MKILVTGGAGFIGSHVAEAYRDAVHQVIVVDDLSTGKRANIPKGVLFSRADIGSPDLVRIFMRHRPDLVNHHAAQIDARVSSDDPKKDAAINVMGLLNLLDR